MKSYKVGMTLLSDAEIDNLKMCIDYKLSDENLINEEIIKDLRQLRKKLSKIEMKGVFV